LTEGMMVSSCWSDMLAKLITAIGKDDFCQCLADCCQNLTGYNSAVMIIFTPHQKPSLIYNNLNQDDVEPTLGSYFAGAYLLDPFYVLYKSNATDGIYRLKDIAPEEFFDTKYYRNYFHDTRIIDETAIMLKINEGFYLNVSLCLREGGDVSKLNVDALKLVYPFLSAACLQNWSREEQIAPLRATGSSAGEFGTTLDAAFSSFGTSFLTPRECEIVHLILKGYSTKSIAKLLNISDGTVKVHRKRFHVKLEVSSQAELFSLFLEAISMVPLGSNKDPLELYYLSQQPNNHIENTG